MPFACRLKKMEAERLQEASGDKLDEEAKARRKKCVSFVAVSGTLYAANGSCRAVQI